MTKRLLAASALFIAIAATAGTGALRCTLTGKIIDSCCCTKAKNGNLHCTLANKDIKSCCCRAAK